MGRLNAVRRLLQAKTLISPLSSRLSSPISRSLLLSPPQFLLEPSNCYSTSAPYVSRIFCSSGPSGQDDNASLGPVAVDYSGLLQEDEFHKLADSTIHHLLEKIEEFGDSMDIDGFDIDYRNQVLTVKFGNLGTYVLNKQTPNRQIWMSSPVSGPSRFDWDRNAEAWVYRRTKNYLFEILESELEQLCGNTISLS
ncbi:frataxin, mitochondrial-like [Apium graveolens]|uniref:frataxin, mitochondrial-like n=1 Tax=Apium graveolens TaxID=4045 RepID=UPI003D7AEC0C